jgi:phage baseplate assembly protein W
MTVENSYFVDINNIFYTDATLVTENSYQAINNSIHNIIFTNKGEKVGDPEFGTSIKKLLFNQMDVITEHLMRSELIDTIERYEPRVIIDDVSVTADYDSNLYRIQIIYRIIKSPDVQEKFVSVLKRL